MAKQAKVYIVTKGKFLKEHPLNPFKNDTLYLYHHLSGAQVLGIFTSFNKTRNFSKSMVEKYLKEESLDPTSYVVQGYVTEKLEKLVGINYILLTPASSNRETDLQVVNIKPCELDTGLSDGNPEEIRKARKEDYKVRSEQKQRLI